MSCSKQGELKRGAWSEEEDEILTNFVNLHGHGKWRRIAQNAGLKRCGKSCRLRWLNYLRPDIKRGDLTVDEEDLIIRLHRLLGNRWALIAGRLPGRTDNEIKNYWNTKLMKKHNKATQFSSSTTMKFEDQDGHKTQEDTHRMVNNQERQEFETSKVIPNADELTDGMIFFPASGNNVDFLADIDEIGCGFSGGFVVPELENVVGSWAQGSWEDDAKLLDVEMMDYSGDGDPILLDIELKQLASFLDLDQED